MIAASSAVEEEINEELVLMNAMAIRRYGTGEEKREKWVPAKENSGHGYLNIRAIQCHVATKGDTESTEFEMQEEQNDSTRICQYIPPRLWKSLVCPVATKEKSRLWCRRTHRGSDAHSLVNFRSRCSSPT